MYSGTSAPVRLAAGAHAFDSSRGGGASAAAAGEATNAATRQAKTWRTNISSLGICFARGPRALDRRIGGEGREVKGGSPPPNRPRLDPMSLAIDGVACL